MKINNLILDIDDCNEDVLIKIELEEVVDVDIFKLEQIDYFDFCKENNITTYYGLIDLMEDYGCAIDSNDYKKIKKIEQFIKKINEITSLKKEYFIKIKEKNNQDLLDFAKKENLFDDAKINEMKQSFESEIYHLQNCD